MPRPVCPSGAHGALALALGSFPGPHAFVSLSTPWVPPAVTCALARTASARILPVPVPMPLAAPTSADRAPLHSLRSVSARLCALLASLRVLPVPGPFPAPCPVSCRPLPVPCPSPLPLASAPCPRLRPRSLPCAPRPAPFACPWVLPLLPPASRSALPWPAPCPRCALFPALPDHAPGVLLPPQLRRRDARRCTLGRRGCTGRGRPVGKAASEGYGLGGLVWVWLGLVWARYFAPSLLSAAAAAAPGEAPGARAGATPRAGGVPGAAVGAAARLAGAAVSAPCAPGAPSWHGAAGLAAWAAGAVSSAGAGPRVDGSVSAGAARGCPAGRPTGTAASASRRSSRSARVSPAHPERRGRGSGTGVVAVVLLGEALGVRHHCYPGRHAWWQACPLHYLLVHLYCAAGSAVQCSSGGRGGGDVGPAVALAPCGRGPVAIHWHWGGRWVSHAAHTLRHSSQSGAGLRALGPRGSSGGAEGSRTRWTPVTAVTSYVRRKVCTPSRAAGAGRGGRGTGAAPYRWFGVIPRTRSGSPRVVTKRRSRGVPGRSCQRTCPLWWAPLLLERGGDRFLPAQPRGAWVAGRRAGHQVGSLGKASQTTAYGKVGLAQSYTGLVGRGRVGASSAPSSEYRDFAHLQILVRRM